MTSATADPGDAQLAGRYGCDYSSNGSTAADIESQPSVVVYTAASHITLDMLKVGMDSASSQASPTVAIAGVGDQAYAGSSGVIAQAGKYFVEVRGLSADVLGNHAPATGMAQAVITALG